MTDAENRRRRPPRREAAQVRNHRSLTVNNNRATVVIPISVVITVLPNNCLVGISAIPIPRVFAVTIAITITMTFTHRYATRTYADSDLLRSGRNCAKNTHHGGYRYCVSDHCLLLLM
jgi:hypothetical protein